MGLQEYIVRRDKFDPRQDLGYGFPCCACKHMTQSAKDEPCRTCDHNFNAVPATPPRDGEGQHKGPA